MFPFGHGLSYTRFDHAGLKAAGEEKLSVTFTVKNTGKVRGQDVAQVYVSPKAGGWEAPKRLAGFRKLDLAPGASTTVTLTVDPRLLATYDGGSWKIAGGDYEVMLGASSRDLPVRRTVTLKARTWSARVGG